MATSWKSFYCWLVKPLCKYYYRGERKDWRIKKTTKIKLTLQAKESVLQMEKKRPNEFLLNSCLCFSYIKEKVNWIETNVWQRLYKMIHSFASSSAFQSMLPLFFTLQVALSLCMVLFYGVGSGIVLWTFIESGLLWT